MTFPWSHRKPVAELEFELSFRVQRLNNKTLSNTCDGKDLLTGAVFHGACECEIPLKFGRVAQLLPLIT